MWIFFIILAAVVIWVAYDITQRHHAILHNFPLIGHLRYWLELIGPELRQYIVTSNNEERPFSRDQRRWVYASSKKENNYFGFGSDNDMELTPNYIIIKHSAFPLREPQPGMPGYDPKYPLPCAKVWGATRKRAKAFRPASAIYVSGMSYGSLSGAAVEALNCGAEIAGCLHNTGEGGISPYHLRGGDLIWQIGTGYFGCRNPDGSFSMDRFLENTARHPQIKAIEVKLSQGGKAGLGGIVPAVKVTERIARIRGIPQGEDCQSPPYHSAFSDVDSMLDFVEQLAEATGLPVGIKSAVGEQSVWSDLARLMEAGERGVDFITIDGGEGGTGAAPLAFADHVALPFKMAFSRVYKEFAERGLHERVAFVGSGKLGFPETALLAFAMGCDSIAVAREPMLAIGCIQAQLCHTGRCPTGITTHNRWLVAGLDPTLKAARLANYIITLRKELLRLSYACGAAHPAFVTSEHIEILDGRYGSSTLEELFGYQKGYGLPSAEDGQNIVELMTGT